MRARVGDTVLVQVDIGIWRPMIITSCGVQAIHRYATPRTGAEPDPLEFRVNGTIFCEAEDHTKPLFRGWGVMNDPARAGGRPDRSFPFGYAELLKEGEGVGNWKHRSLPPRVPTPALQGGGGR